jgi:hypothetical protein
LNDFFTKNLNKIVAENIRGIGLCLWSYWKDHDEQDLMDLDSECGRY